MRYALIINGVVDTIYYDEPLNRVGEEEYQAEAGMDDDGNPVMETRTRPVFERMASVEEVADDVMAGFLRDGAGFVAPPPPPPPVPQYVTPWQARAALLHAGLLANVEAMVDSMPNSEAYIAWHYAERIARNSPLIAALAPQLQLSDAQLDALFIDAASRSL